MKKLIYLLLALMIIFSFVACDDSTTAGKDISVENSVIPEGKKYIVTFEIVGSEEEPEERIYDENEVINLNEIAAELTDSNYSSYIVLKDDLDVTGIYNSTRGNLVINYPYVIRITMAEEETQKSEVDEE